MQKIINVIAIASGIISLSVVGGGVYLYTQKDAIIESVTEKALGSIGGGALGGALGGLGGQEAPEPMEALPSLPTGPVNPF
tara:strand:- start:2859 stop:3101 length:243 start_codon:yes stop_codon:yes gene_type:complete